CAAAAEIRSRGPRDPVSSPLERGRRWPASRARSSEGSVPRGESPSRTSSPMASASATSTPADARKERMPSRLQAMLAKPGEVPESEGDEWAYEIKWDGVRALGYASRGKWSMQSRRLEEVTARYPELAGIAEVLADRRAVLDGEVVALDKQGRPRFQLIQSRM